MSTSFFQQQDRAKKNTGRLVFLFILAVLTLIALTYLVCFGLFVYLEQEKTDKTPSLFQPLLLLGVAFAVISLIGCGSAYKVAQLASGGKSVALMLGGQEIPSNTRAIRERRLLNIVEEMSIASGVPVPPVYLLPDEKGINAFAAGHSPGDAVVAVSQGSLDYLTRDELQGVVAHEFSHILNGDMRLNIRMMGLIHGIVLLSIVGIYLMQVMSNTSSSGSKKKDTGMQLFLLGVALYILGSVGAFFGTLIQAAVSRQREFLADASAIQFTRNPDGIGGALKKIGGLSEGATINNAHAAEMCHMFFADGISKRMSSLLSTHPPLDERIRHIDPHWDGVFPEVRPINVEHEERKPEKKTGTPPLSIPGMPQLPIPVAGAVLGFAADAAEQHVGTPTASGLAAAAAFTEDISADIREMIGEPFSARAAIYALLLDSNPQVRDRQIERLRSEAEPRDLDETLRLENRARSVPPGARLTMVHLAIPALRTMSPQQYRTFRTQVENLIAADERVDLFEFCLQRVLLHHLDQAFELKRPPRVSYRTEEHLIGSAASILGTVARNGHETEDAAATAFALGYREWLITPSKFPAADQCTLEHFAEALDNFEEAAPFLKKKLIRACVTCICADRQVTAAEFELLRAICSSLDCPLPPLTQGSIR